MHKIFSLKSWLRLYHGFPAGDAALQVASRWCEDPLSHPALARMNARELADLPLARSQRACKDQAIEATQPGDSRRQ